MGPGAGDGAVERERGVPRAHERGRTVRRDRELAHRRRGRGARATIASVWASLWTRLSPSSLAVHDVAHDATHDAVSMAVQVQDMVVADLSFFAFSHDPVALDAKRAADSGSVYIKLAVGLGEMLKSAGADGAL